MCPLTLRPLRWRRLLIDPLLLCEPEFEIVHGHMDPIIHVRFTPFARLDPVRFVLVVALDRSNITASAEASEGPFRHPLANAELGSDVEGSEEEQLPVFAVPEGAEVLLGQLAHLEDGRLVVHRTIPSTNCASASNARRFSSRYSCRSYTPRTPRITCPRQPSAISA